MLISIQVATKASKNELKQISETTFKAKITTAPENGKANDRLIELLSKQFKTAKSNITIKSGATSKKKLIEIL